MTKVIRKEESSPKEYLNKSFLEELNYKIWSTKSARFNADKRLKVKAKLSSISLAILSAYLIIASLISVYNINSNGEQNFLNYIITGLSILVLVLNQFESSQEYMLNAKGFHDCGLELSEIYNELRIFKTIKKNPTELEVYLCGKNISEKYQTILKNYQNHSSIDYDMFQVSNVDYFKKIAPDKVTPKAIKKVRLRYNWHIYGWYSIMIVFPPILFFFLIVC